MEEYLPVYYTTFRRNFPDIAEAYGELAERCHEAGPLDEKTRRLVKLGIAFGLSSEGAIKSHVRRALDVGVSPQEVRHAVLLMLTTAGFPAMIAALNWAEEVLQARAEA